MNVVALWRDEGPVLRRLLVFQLFSNLGAGVFALLFNLYLLALGYHEDLVGLTAGLSTLGQGLAALVAGRLVNRLGAPRTLALALGVFTIASTGQALVGDRLSIAILAIAVGVGTAWMTVPVLPLLAERIANEARADASALVFAVQNLSVTAGTFLGGILPTALVYGGLSLIQRDRLALLIGIAVGALGLFPLLGLAQASPTARHGGTAMIGPDLEATPRRVRRTVWGYAGASTLLSIGAGAFIPFVNVYLARLGANAEAIGSILALTGAIGALISLLAPTLARRFGPMPTMLALRAAPIPIALGLAAFPSLVLVVALQAARQIGANLAWPIEVNLVSERVPGRALANAYGLRVAAWNLSWALISIVAGQLIVHGGYNAPLYILVVATSLGVITLYSALGKRGK